MSTLTLWSRPSRRSPSSWTDLTTDRVRTVVYGILVVFWFTLPWEGVVKIAGGATLARAVGGVLALAGVAAVLIAGRRVRPNEYILLVMAFAALVALSSFWTVTPGPTSQVTTTMIQLAVMVLVTWEFTDSRRRVLGLMSAWVAGSVVVGAVASFAFVSGQSATRYSAPGTSHGDVAYSLLVAVPMAWYLSLQTDRAVLVWLYRLFVPFACLGVVLTASRAGLLSMGLALAIIPLTFRWLTPGGRIGVALATLASGAVATVLAAAASGPIARLATTSSEISTGTLDQRTTLWGIAWGLMREHPLLGLGGGGSKNAVSGEFQQARGLHNTFLSVSVEFGLLGLTVFLLAMVAAFYPALTKLPRLETRMAWVLAIIFLASLLPRHADFFKSTWALLTLLALMGKLLVDRAVHNRVRADTPPVAPVSGPAPAPPALLPTSPVGGAHRSAVTNDVKTPESTQPTASFRPLNGGLRMLGDDSQQQG